MAWSVSVPRKADEGSGWIVPLVDLGGREKLLLRFETGDLAGEAANLLRAIIVQATDIRLIEE
jgi:hypothetical protein